METVTALCSCSSSRRCSPQAAITVKPQCAGSTNDDEKAEVVGIDTEMARWIKACSATRVGDSDRLWLGGVY